MITVYLNQEAINLDANSSVQEMLEQVTPPTQPFAIALNSQFVPRSSYAQTRLAMGDQVDLVVATQGG